MNHIISAKRNKFKKLDVPSFVHCLSQGYVEENTNGCGDKKTEYLVPDNIIGMSVRLACDIHDLEFTEIINEYNAKFIEQNPTRREVAKNKMIAANKRFKKNMIVIANVKFEEERKGLFSLFFWLSEVKQARIRRKTRLKIINIFYLGVKYGGWNSLKEKLK